MPGQAAFVDAKGAKLTVRDAPEWPIKDDEVKIKVHAVAINPVDHHIVVSCDFICGAPKAD